MTGRLIYIMGPSGSGKDAVLLGLHALLGKDGYVAPRLVTRPAVCPERWSVPVSPAEFTRLEGGGGLAMAWRANGLAYGVRCDIDDRLAQGCDVLVNGSREYLHQARRRYPDLVPVLLSVDSALLRQRLTDRGRENSAQIGERLARNARFASLSCPADAMPVFVVDNSGAIDDAIRTLHVYLMRTRTRMAQSCG